MLTDLKVRCVYCRRQSYFHVFIVEESVNTAVYTQCPNKKCEKFVDVWYFPKERLPDYLEAILRGKEPGE